MTTPTIITDRLALRRWCDEDLPAFAAMNADPAVMAFLPKVLDRAESDAFAERIETSFDTLGYGLWAVEPRASGELLGFTGLALQIFPAHFTPAVEVGWRLRRSAWGHGYATEAAQAAVTFGFTTFGFNEIVSMTAVGNLRSAAVMQRIGMNHDPSDDFDHPLLPDEHPLSRHLLYRLSRAQWEQQQQPNVKYSYIETSGE